MKKHFVIFYSHGTMVAETTQQPINRWDVDEAVEMSKKIKERHSASPYGFYFITRQRKEDEFDSKEIKRSGMYFLGGTVFTLKEIKKRNDPKDKVLISNMEYNGYDKIVTNNNSWKWTQPLGENDVVLDINL